MDREQEELQFLGFFGMCKESITIISKWSKIFTKITLSLILPFSIIFLANIEISMLLTAKIRHDEQTMDFAREGTTAYDKISNLIFSERALNFLVKLVYIVILLIVLLVFSLLATSSVVYTVACIYIGKDITFRKVMSVVPKVWKRLFVTFLWSFAFFSAYHFITLFFFLIWTILYRGGDLGMVFLYLMIAMYSLGLVYIGLIWQLASVVSVVEVIYGIQAMIKSRALVAGKTGVSLAIFLCLSIWSVGIQYLFEQFVVLDAKIAIGGKIGYGALSLFLLSLFVLISLVIQTIIYFVCKSYHHESIDKSALSDHLEEYLGEYVPFTAEDVQMERMEV